jgi:hypothetical protein
MGSRGWLIADSNQVYFDVPLTVSNGTDGILTCGAAEPSSKINPRQSFPGANERRREMLFKPWRT